MNLDSGKNDKFYHTPAEHSEGLIGSFRNAIPFLQSKAQQKKEAERKSNPEVRVTLEEQAISPADPSQEALARSAATLCETQYKSLAQCVVGGGTDCAAPRKAYNQCVKHDVARFTPGDICPQFRRYKRCLYAGPWLERVFPPLKLKIEEPSKAEAFSLYDAVWAPEMPPPAMRFMYNWHLNRQFSRSRVAATFTDEEALSRSLDPVDHKRPSILSPNSYHTGPQGKWFDVVRANPQIFQYDNPFDSLPELKVDLKLLANKSPRPYTAALQTLVGVKSEAELGFRTPYDAAHALAEATAAPESLHFDRLSWCDTYKNDFIRCAKETARSVPLPKSIPINA